METSNTFGLGNAAGITFTGIASGLDTEGIIAALTKLEKKPVELALLKKGTLSSLAGLVNSLSTKLKSLRDKAAKLTTIAESSAFAVTTSDAAKATATASTGAVAGAHTLKITQLASTAKEYATGATAYANSNVTTVGTGSITITYAGTASAPIDVTGKTLNDVVASINSAELGVTASAVNVGTESAPDFRLVVTGNDTGASKTVSVAVDAGVNLNFSTLATAKNAQFQIDGLTIQRENNVVSDVVSGVTFTLLGLTGATDATLTVSPDVSAIKSRIKELVDSFNDVAKFVKQNSNYDPSTQVAGAFFNDSTIGSIASRLRQLVLGNGSSYTTAANFDSLSAVGVSLQSDGTLKLDDAKLTAALNENSGAVLDLFADTDGSSGPDQGLALQLRQFADDATVGGTDPATGVAYDGLLVAKNAAIQKQIATLVDTIAKGEAHADTFAKALKLKYAAFESAIGNLKAQQQALFAKFG